MILDDFLSLDLKGGIYAPLTLTSADSRDIARVGLEGRG